MKNAEALKPSPLKAKLISQAVKDPLFKEALKAAASEIKHSSVLAPNEATVESAFERILYAVLLDAGIHFHPEKESPIKTRRHSASGRTDSRIGALIIEYKQPSTLSSPKDRTKAIAQISSYLEAISGNIKNETIGFLTDGTKILEIHSQYGEITAISSFSDLDDISLMRLVKSIIALASSALSSQNLIRDFCGEAYDGTVFQVARNLNKILEYNTTLKTEMLRTEWEALFRLAHEDQSQQKRIEERRKILGEIFRISIKDATMEYRALFSLHTSYAIVLKLIAFRVVSDVKFKTALMNYKELTSSDSDVVRSFCANLEDGELFRQIGIINLLEGDFFSWYVDAAQWNDKIASGVKGILTTLSRYEDIKVVFDSEKAVDLFRSLYEATVPQVVRASFGEFYTPYWLAEHVVDSSRCGPNWTAIDPCCGSGTFVIAAIAKMRQELTGKPPTTIVLSILSRIYGIDLNPLAVLTARIHYFLHIADLIEDFEDDLVIPVFLGDASNVPVRKHIEGVNFLYYELKTLKTPLSVFIPVAMANDTKRFSLTMFEFERLVRDGSHKEARAYLLSEAGACKELPIIEKRVGALADQIIFLEQNKWNGIWARIIANFISTASIGPFSNVIGNPPWIDWKSLPSGYRDKVKNLCIDRGLFSGAGRTGGINLNICALITHVAAANWLAKGGHLAFLMPKELANQASYEGWRRAVGGARFSLIEMNDWSDAGHPFDPVKEDFMTFIFEARARNLKTIPVTRFKNKGKTKSHLWSTLTEALPNLEEKKLFAGQIIEGSTAYTIAETEKELEQFRQLAGSCAYIGREGIEFYPQELMLFHYEEPGPKSGTVWVKNIQVSKSKYKIPQQRILLETKFLHPLAKGPNIGPFSYEDPNILVAFPYEEATPHAPIKRSELKKISPLLLEFYRKFKTQLEKQTKYSDSIRGEGEFYGVARTGPYSFKSCYVAYRDNTKWCATVLTSKIMPWGEEKRYLFQNHAVSMCESETGTIINESEAYFITGIFNTNIVKKFIYSSSDNRSFKIRPPIYVPIFDETDKDHMEISVLSRKAQKFPDRQEEYIKKIEKAYMRICEKR